MVELLQTLWPRKHFVVLVNLFLWGFYIIQWNSVHMWFTAWFAAMFIVPIYWRSKIVTTPEYLENAVSVIESARFARAR